MSTQPPAPTKGQDQRTQTSGAPAEGAAQDAIFSADDFYTDPTPPAPAGKTGGKQPAQRQAKPGERGGETDDNAAAGEGDGERGGETDDNAAAGEGDGEGERGGETDDNAVAGEGDGEAQPDTEAVARVNEWLGAVAQNAEKAALLKVPVKVNGETAEVTLHDLVKNFQIGEAAAQHLDEAKAIKARAQQEMQTQIETLTGEIAVAATLIGHFESDLAAQEKAVDWDKLRADDPAEWSAKKSEFAERRQSLERMKNEARDAYQRSVRTNEEQLKTGLRDTVNAERAKLFEAIPALADPTKGKAERAKLTKYLLDLGFEKQDIQGAVDHRLHVMAHKAMLYDAQQGKVDTAKKRLREVPKVLKPGGKPAPKPKPKSDAEIMYG